MPSQTAPHRAASLPPTVPAASLGAGACPKPLPRVTCATQARRSTAVYIGPLSRAVTAVTQPRFAESPDDRLCTCPSKESLPSPRPAEHVHSPRSSPTESPYSSCHHLMQLLRNGTQALTLLAGPPAWPGRIRHRNLRPLCGRKRPSTGCIAANDDRKSAPRASNPSRPRVRTQLWAAVPLHPKACHSDLPCSVARECQSFRSPGALARCS